MAFDELDRMKEPSERKATPAGSWDNLSDKERKERFARRERLGLVGAQDDGFFGELSDQFQGSVISGLKGVGATANELGLGSGMQDYFQGVLNRNQQWNTPEERSVSGYIGGAIGNAAGSTAVIAPAIAADALFGTKGAATFALVFGQSFGDNLQRNREVYGPGNEEKSIGLAAAESTVDSFIEIALGTVPMLGKSLKGLTYAGKRQLVKGMFREAEKQLGRSGAKRFFLGMAKNGAEEMTEEGLQYVNSWMWRAMGGDQSNEFKPGEMADSMAQGLIGGAALGITGGGQNVNLYGKPRPWLNQRTAEPAPASAPVSPASGMASDTAPAPGMETVSPIPETETFNPEAAKSTSARLTEEVAKEFGLKVRYFDEEGAPSPVDDKGNSVNGWYDEKNNEYWIDRNDPEMNPLETLGHEFKHFLDTNHSDLVKKFDELMKSGMNEAGKQALSETEADYRQSGYPAGQGEIEFSADTFGKMWTEPEFWRDVAQRAEKLESGMGQRMIDALQEFIKIVRAKLKNIGTPEAKQLFDNMGELRSEAARIMAEIKRQNGTSTEAENVVGVKGSDMVQSIPVSDLAIDPARFQFKSKANIVTGVDESNKLGGEWDPKTAGNLYVWEDKNGKKFVVNGHHRFQLAQNSGVQAVNAIVDREADGVTAEQARRNGVLINIRDEQGDVKDYADFVRQEDMSEETAEKEGILAREKGRRGYTIGRYASDNLYSIFKADEISEPKAETIAEIARKDEGLEAAGIRAAKNMPNAQLREFLKCLKNMPRETNEQGDLFGFDDSAIQMSEKLSKLAAKHIREIGDKLKAVRQAVKNPETAAKGDVKVGKNAQKIYDQTLRDQLEWEHWYTNPELSAQLREEAGIETDPESNVESSNVESSQSKVESSNVPDVGNTEEKSVVKENLTTDEEISDVGDIISKTEGGTNARIWALKNLKDGKYNAFGLTFEKKTNAQNEPSFIIDGYPYDLDTFETKIRVSEAQKNFKEQYNPYKEPREITNSTYERAQKRMEKHAGGVVTGRNVQPGPDITNKESGRFNMDSDTPLLTPEEDANDFQLFDETPEEVRAREAKAERDEAARIERAKKEAEKAAPDLDFSSPEEQKQDADTIIRNTAPGSVERVNAFMGLPDGEHTIDGKKFTKHGLEFERDGRKLSARGIERSFKDVPKNTENVYLRMPIDRVRQDAENGVKIAQDALKILEKQTATDYIKDKENNNASSTSTNLERSSEVRNTENGTDATSLLDDGRTDLRVSGQRGRSTGSAGIRTEADTGNADVASQSDGSGSGAVDGGTLSGDRTGAADRSQSVGGVENRPSGIRTGDDANGADADNHAAEETPRKPKSQQEADRVKVVPRDRKNIAETLPTLFPEQCDDVFKAENRYSHGKGMLFTNATGTGKTFTGLGIIKRFARQGKNNILIVTPTDKKNRDWASDAKRVNLTVTPLSGTGDNGGTGIAVTTYANFRQNESLLRRNWDLLVFDESHKISSAEGKIDTLAKQQLDRLAGVKDIPFRRAFEENKSMLLDELAKIDPDYKRYDLERNPQSENPVLSVRDIEEHWEELPKNVQKVLKDREAELSRSKVLFLSATPFSYHNSLLYADGYLFDIPEREANGYNQPDGVQQFFIDNFGYRMRYNKLTKPDADVDVSVMERAFYEKMRKSGAVSGRMLEIDKDYSREFFRVQSDLGEKIQAGMDMVMDYKQYPAISALIHKLYDYNYVTSLLECLKSKATVDEIKKDLDAGRKVVVFHNRNTGTPAHPFRLGVLYNYCETERQHQQLKEDIDRFESEHPELVHLRLNDLQNPLMYFRKIFGDNALFFDGTVPAKRRAMNVDEFNDAKSGRNLIVVQIEAGKEGISLHDTKGDAQRVLYNLGLPTKPTDLIQSEGRIYRLGSKSNAIFRYPVTGLPMERYAFGSKINQRASTAENLGMGDAARNLRDALREGYMNAGESLSFDQQGVGGKEADRGYDAASDYDRAKTFYFGQMKRTSKNKSAEGTDYYATPEPIGYKMVEWAHLNPGDKVLEPSAGHGAIARFFPDTVDAKAIEPSNDLYSKLSVNTTAKIIRERFEDHNPVNKYDCVVMNPPFGLGGKTAIEHLSKAFDRHLNNFGRVIAIIPEGGMADRRFSAWLNNTEDAHLTAEIGLPNVTFQRAGTNVKTKIVVIDKADSYCADYLPLPQQRIDISAENINELFDRMENISMPNRGSFRNNVNDRSYNDESEENSESRIHYSLVRDAQKKRELDEAERKGEVIHTYRAAQLVDGKLYPPMAGRINGDWVKPIQLGAWEQSDEHPELVKEVNGKYKFKLDKGNGSSIEAAYNPYIHSSPTPLNDQFSSAYKRPELVTLEVIVPKSELSSGYRADMAKDSVGMMEWKAGVVQGKLTGKREVMLSRWDKPIRIVPDSEVAEKIAGMLDGKNVSIPANVVTPQLREELEKIGVPVTDNLPRRGSFDSGRDYSLKRHKQVNPIREPGDVQSQHDARLDDPYETRSNAAVNEQAKRRIIGMGGLDESIKMMLSGDFAIGTDVSQRVLQLVLNSEEFKKLNADARAKISDLYIRDAGTEIARSLAARRLGVLKTDDIKSIQAHINAFMAKIDKKKPHNDLRKQILDEFGFDIDNLPEELANDPDKLDGIIRRMMAERATIFDKAYEFWINSILSGIPTHLANTIGNVSNAAYELGVKRLAEASINIAAKRKDGATFGEFKEMCRAIDWKGAFERAERSFRLETLTNTGKLDHARTAIGGKPGRAIRYPSRLLRAADEFAKAIVQPVEATAYAYREGTANKLKGEDLANYVATQVQQEGSTANQFGNKRAMELTFQEEPGKAVEQLIRWREAGGVFGTLLKFELPFIKTPANILRQGVRKSPVGAINLAWQTGKALAGKRNIDGQYISLAAEQLVAWGCVAMLAGGIDDDDDQPSLTGTSPRYGSAEQKFKANKIPPYSIRIGDNYYSYKRIEPLSNGLAFIADGLDAYKRAKRGEDGTRIMKRLIGGVKQLVAEKSFLDSLGEINRVVSDPERSFAQSVTNFASSWMPNVVRQTMNLWDDNVRDNKSRSKGTEWLEDQFQITTNRMGVTRGAPKLDYFGREIKKDSLADSGPLWPLMRLLPIQSIDPDGNMNKAESLIWRYNQNHPDAEYYPDVPSFYFQRDGKKLYMTGEDYQEFARKSGELALKQINNAFRHGLLHEDKPSEKDIELIKKIFTRARKEVRDEMYRKHRYSE